MVITDNKNIDTNSKTTRARTFTFTDIKPEEYPRKNPWEDLSLEEDPPKPKDQSPKPEAPQATIPFTQEAKTKPIPTPTVTAKVTRERFIYHMDKIRAYDKLQQRIDELTGSIRGAHTGVSAFEFDLYPMVLEMLRMLDDCLNTPYVNILDWTMTTKVSASMQHIDYAEYTTRLIEAWATELEYGDQGEIKIYDSDNNVYVRLQSADDLYDYLYCTRQN